MTQFQRAQLLTNVTSPEGHLTPEQVAAALRLPMPVAFIGPYGTLLAANLLNYWTWDCLSLGDPIVPQLLIGQEVFNFLLYKFHRMPFHLNHEALITKRLIAILADAGRALATFNPFILHVGYKLAQAGYHLAPLESILASDTYRSAHTWQYPIHLLDPSSNSSTNYLTFHVTVKRVNDPQHHVVMNDDPYGFLVTYDPSTDPYTSRRIRTIFQQLTETYSPSSYVQHQSPAHRAGLYTNSNHILLDLQRHTDDLDLSFSSGTVRYFHIASEAVGDMLSRSDPPAWLLSPEGDIFIANPSMFYIWEALKPDAPLRPDALIGRNVFDLFADGLASTRIPDTPIELVERLARAKSSVHKALIRYYDRQAYQHFADVLHDPRRHSHLAELYENTSEHYDLQWTYDLNIRKPFSNDKHDLLSFDATVVIVRSATTTIGYLAVYQPTASTQSKIHRELDLIRTQYADCLPVLHYPSYYPELTEDSLFNIIDHNDAFRWLLGHWTDHHLFELMSSHQFEWSVILAGDSPSVIKDRAIQYFHFVYSQIVDVYPHYSELHHRMLTHLDAIIPGFSERYHTTSSTPLPKPLLRGQYNDACRLSFSSPLLPDMTIHFLSKVWFPSEAMLCDKGVSYFREVLVPFHDNDSTKMTLMLLHLFRSVLPRRHFSTAPLQRCMWVAAAIRTIAEGLSRDETDALWHPVTSFINEWNNLRAIVGSDERVAAVQLRGAMFLALTHPTPLSENSIVLLSLLLKLSDADILPVLKSVIDLRGDASYNWELLLARIENPRNVDAFNSLANMSIRIEQAFNGDLDSSFRAGQVAAEPDPVAAEDIPAVLRMANQMYPDVLFEDLVDDQLSRVIREVRNMRVTSLAKMLKDIRPGYERLFKSD